MRPNVQLKYGPMKKYKGNRTASQCKTKLHNLKLKYKKAKLRNNTSGQSRNTCPFFEELDAVLGTKPSIAPKLILEGCVQLQAASILNA